MASAKKANNQKKLPEVIVESPQELQRCCDHIASTRRFGFDTEFVGEETYHPRLCLVQVATDDFLYIIDPESVGPLDRFWDLVVDPKNLVVVHAGREEIRLCHLWSGGSVPGNLFDLQIAAGLTGLVYPLSHGNLVHQILGVKLAKGETLTEWRNRPLSASQIRYAFDDVRYLLPIWEQLHTKLDQLHRLSWAKEEFDRLKQMASPDFQKANLHLERWRKLRGTGSLNRVQLAIVRALFDWREDKAAHHNRPARAILRDDLLIEIAKRNPHRAKDLQVVRGLPRNLMDGILQVVEQVRSLPTSDHPLMQDKEQDPAHLSLINHLLQAVLGNYCTENELATNLVASTQDLKGLVKAHYRNEKPDATSLLQTGWRSQYILPLLEDTLLGNMSIRISDLQCSTPLELIIKKNPD